MPDGSFPASVDPERGILDPLPLRSPVEGGDEKSSLTQVDGMPVLGFQATKEALPPSKDVVLLSRLKPVQKPKKKVPAWILFALWFNTYRCSLISSPRS
jgi:hypothetical protein